VKITVVAIIYSLSIKNIFIYIKLLKTIGVYVVNFRIESTVSAKTFDI